MRQIAEMGAYVKLARKRGISHIFGERHEDEMQLEYDNMSADAYPIQSGQEASRRAARLKLTKGVRSHYQFTLRFF